MRLALIQGTRIAQVQADAFPVADPLFWAEVPDDTSTRDAYVDGAVVKYAAPPGPSLNARVNADRDRRIAIGVTAATSTGKSVPVDTRGDADLRNIQGLVTVSQVKIAGGDGSPLSFRGADDAVHELSPAEMIEVGMQVAAHVDAHYRAAWAIKDAAEAPADVTDDALWP